MDASKAGHAILGALMNDYDVVAKISGWPEDVGYSTVTIMDNAQRPDQHKDPKFWSLGPDKGDARNHGL